MFAILSPLSQDNEINFLNLQKIMIILEQLEMIQLDLTLFPYSSFEIIKHLKWVSYRKNIPTARERPSKSGG